MAGRTGAGAEGGGAAAIAAAKTAQICMQAQGRVLGTCLLEGLIQCVGPCLEEARRNALLKAAQRGLAIQQRHPVDDRARQAADLYSGQRPFGETCMQTSMPSQQASMHFVLMPCWGAEALLGY